MDTVKLAELWIAGHITNQEFLFLCGAVRMRNELTISEVTNATITSSNKRNDSNSGGGIFATTE